MFFYLGSLELSNVKILRVTIFVYIELMIPFQIFDNGICFSWYVTFLDAKKF